MARADVPKNTPKSKRRRAELLTAAQLVFEREGYFDTRVADIAAAAGVSHGTFYTYFDSKDDVLHVLIDGVSDELFAAASAPPDGPAAALDVLEHSIRTFMHVYRDRADILRVLDQATASSEAFLAIRTGIRNRFRQRVERVLRSHDVGLDPVHGAYALGGMIEDFARGAYQFGLDVDEDVAIATLTLIWARAVGMAPPPIS